MIVQSLVPLCNERALRHREIVGLVRMEADHGFVACAASAFLPKFSATAESANHIELKLFARAIEGEAWRSLSVIVVSVSFGFLCGLFTGQSCFLIP